MKFEPEAESRKQAAPDVQVVAPALASAAVVKGSHGLHVTLRSLFMGTTGNNTWSDDKPEDVEEDVEYVLDKQIKEIGRKALKTPRKVVDHWRK